MWARRLKSEIRRLWLVIVESNYSRVRMTIPHALGKALSDVPVVGPQFRLDAVFQ